jgi:hypothetical protein
MILPVGGNSGLTLRRLIGESYKLIQEDVDECDGDVLERG